MSDYRIGSFFSGYGGLERAVQAVFGGEVVWHSEIDPAASKVLAHHDPQVPNLGDITALDFAGVASVDIVTGGFPCTDVSLAGLGLGLRAGTRSGLWTHMAAALDALRPRLVVIENVRGLLSAHADSALEPCPWCVGDGSVSGLRALGAVLGDLASIGYDARWCGLRAADVGAPHGRFRIFITARPAADTSGEGWQHRRGGPTPTESGHSGPQVRGGPPEPGRRSSAPADADVVGSVRDGRARRGRTGPADHDQAAAHTGRDGREGREERHLRSETGQPAPLGGDAAGRVLEWGTYRPAIRRWEHVLGRVAPAPTQLSKRGGTQLSPRFVEWMQGLPEGHVTDVPGISRNDQLKMLGNGVVIQQAEAALRFLLAPAELAVAS